MARSTLELPMARKKIGRPATSTRSDVVVKIDKTVAAKRVTWRPRGKSRWPST